MTVRYLVDTDVISETSRSDVVGRGDIAAWMDRSSDRLFLSAITISELEAGIAGMSHRGAHRKAAALRRWLEATVHLYGDRVLSFDLAVARRAGALTAAARQKGRPVGFPDIAIGATALSHGLTVLTRNLRHFSYLDVPSVDPFRELPP